MISSAEDSRPSMQSTPSMQSRAGSVLRCLKAVPSNALSRPRSRLQRGRGLGCPRLGRPFINEVAMSELFVSEHRIFLISHRVLLFYGHPHTAVHRTHTRCMYTPVGCVFFNSQLKNPSYSTSGLTAALMH